MAPLVAHRWKILILIGLCIAGVDQWSKFLAVKHLTPGIAKAATGQQGPVTDERKAELLAEMSNGDQVAAFFTKVKGPCAPFGSRCPTVQVVEGFWNWRYVENPGAAWGLLAKSSDAVRVPLFLAVSVAAMAFIISFVRKLEDEQTLLLLSLSLVFGGALGNFIDRLHLSYVIDFIDWYVGTSHWPTFNFADAAISTGVALLIIDQIRDSVRAKRRSASASAAS